MYSIEADYAGRANVVIVCYLQTKDTESTQKQIQIILQMMIYATIKYHFTFIRMAIVKGGKRKKITSVSKDVETLEPSCMGGGKIKCYSCCQKQYAISSKS